MRPRPVTPSARRRLAGDHRRERALALVVSEAAARGMAAVLNDVEVPGARPQLELLSAPLASVTSLEQRRTS